MPHTTFVLHVHRNECTHCFAEERWSQLYLCDDGDLRHLKNTRSFPDGADLQVVRLPATKVTICARCATSRQSTRPVVSDAEWAATVKRKNTPASPAPRSARTQTKLEDLA